MYFCLAVLNCVKWLKCDVVVDGCDEGTFGLLVGVALYNKSQLVCITPIILTSYPK